jgi:hypothetical protein
MNRGISGFELCPRPRSLASLVDVRVLERDALVEVPAGAKCWAPHSRARIWTFSSAMHGRDHRDHHAAYTFSGVSIVSRCC